jgi:hypothetical protein
MSAPCTLSACQTNQDGKLAVELIVRHAPASLRPLLDSLGYECSVDMMGRRSIICTTPAAIDAARNPLATLFDKTGKFIA